MTIAWMTVAQIGPLGKGAPNEKGPPFGRPFSLVEMAGIEPASGESCRGISTDLARLFLAQGYEAGEMPCAEPRCESAAAPWRHDCSARLLHP